MFVRHGIPETLIYDGGPQFRTFDVQQFAKIWGFIHIITNPYW